MATKTNKLGLSKAELTDAVRSTLVANNGNFDILDSTYVSMQEQINRLKANQITGMASGTEIVVEDSAEMESILKISGNSEQDSRSGKNLLQQDLFTTAKTVNGITFTPNADGSIKISGTATARTDLHLTTKLVEKLTVGKTYTSSIGQEMSSNLRMIVEEIKGSSWVANISYASKTTWAYNGLTSGDAYRVLLVIDSGSVLDTTIYPMIEKGTTATPYEPYGVMPSPDYPSEIRSVKSKSDNLFDKNSSITTGRYLNTTGREETSTNYGISEYIEVEPNTQYISWGTSATGNNPCLNFYDENKTFISAVKHSDKNPITYTTPSNCKYIRESVLMSEIDLFMIEKGNAPTIYQPYGYVPVEARVEGKNLFDIENIDEKLGAERITITGTADKFTVSSSATGAGVYDVVYWNLGIIDYDRFYYKFSTNVSGNNIGSFEIANNLQDKYPKHTRLLTLTSSNFNGSFDVSSYQGKYLIIAIRANMPDLFTSQTISNLIVAKTSEAIKQYEPYKGKTISLPLGDIELRSTPDGTRDTFERVDGVWNKVEYNPSVIFDGSDDEAWGNQSGNADTENTAMFSFGLSSIDTDYYNRISYCNRFKYYINGSVQNSTDDIEGFNFHPSATYSNYIYFRINKSLLPTQDVAGWKSWLASNPLEVVYPIKTPIYTPITDTSLIQALDELENLILHKGYNRITVTSVNGVKAYLDLSYIKDINSVLDNINAIILTLGGGANV